jgi:hypothetical protein
MKNRTVLWLAASLLVFGVAMRLLPHPANLAPVGAIALFGGAVLPRKYAWWLPVAIMAMSDIFIGLYNGFIFTWLGFALVGLYGMTLHNKNNWLRIPLGALGSSVIFFIVSNFGAWAQGQLYTYSLSGLASCYAMALPFFRNTFLGDLAYSGLLFGAYACALKLVIAKSHTAETAL